MTDSELARLMHCMDRPLDGANLRSIFLLLTRAHFSDPANHGYLEDTIGCFKYSDDPKESTLSVQLSYNYDPEKSSPIPAVYVGMDQGTKFGKLDMDNQSAQFADRSGKEYSKLATAGISFIHLARSMDQALLLAESSAAFFMGIRESLKLQLGLSSFDVLSLSPPALVQKDPERYFRVDLQCALSFNFVVSVNIESHRLKKFAIKLQEEAS